MKKFARGILALIVLESSVAIAFGVYYISVEVKGSCNCRGGSFIFIFLLCIFDRSIHIRRKIFRNRLLGYCRPSSSVLIGPMLTNAQVIRSSDVY